MMHYENAGMVFYSVMVFISLIAAIITLKLMKYPGTQSGFEFRRILPVIILGFIVGAKLPVILSYGLRPELVWTGKSYYGALLGGFFAMNIYKAVFGIKGNTGDRFVAPLCLSAAIGKIGCLVYGCCGGIPTEFFIRIKNHAGVYVHPTQLYETIFEASSFIFFIYLYKTKKMQDAHFMLYLLMYMIFRFAIEFIRTEPRVLWNLTVYQWMSIIFVPLFIYLFQRRLKNAV